MKLLARFQIDCVWLEVWTTRAYPIHILICIHIINFANLVTVGKDYLIIYQLNHRSNYSEFSVALNLVLNVTHFVHIRIFIHQSKIFYKLTALL